MSGGGGSSSSPVDKQIARSLQASFLPAADRFGRTFGQGQGLFQGSRLADQSGATLAFQENLAGVLPSLQGGADLASSNVQGFFSPNVAGVEETFTGAFEDQQARDIAIRDNLINTLGSQAGEQFRRNILPGISDASTAAGQFGSSRQGIAEGLAAGEVSSGLNSQIAQLLQQDVLRQDANRQFATQQALAEREGDLTRSLQASQLFPQIQQAQLLPLSLQEQLGLSMDQRAQLELEDMIQQQEAPRNAQLQGLQEYQGLLGFAGPGQFTAPQGEASALQNAAGIASIVSAFSGGPSGGGA